MKKYEFESFENFQMDLKDLITKYASKDEHYFINMVLPFWMSELIASNSDQFSMINPTFIERLQKEQLFKMFMKNVQPNIDWIFSVGAFETDGSIYEVFNLVEKVETIERKVSEIELFASLNIVLEKTFQKITKSFEFKSEYRHHSRIEIVVADKDKKLNIISLKDDKEILIFTLEYDHFSKQELDEMDSFFKQHHLLENKHDKIYFKVEDTNILNSIFLDLNSIQIAYEESDFE